MVFITASKWKVETPINYGMIDVDVAQSVHQMATSLLAEDQKYNQLIQAESGKEQMRKQGLVVNIKQNIYIF